MKKQSQNKIRYSRRAAGRRLINRNKLRSATNLALIIAAPFLPLVANAGHGTETSYHLPHFRQVDAASPAPALGAGAKLHLLADENFPPFSFRAASGAPAGLAVELALAACGEMQLSCSVELRPLAELLPALQGGGGDVLLDGPLITGQTLGEGLMTRPWFRSLGRFAVQEGNPLAEPSAVRLAGRRIAVQKDSAHAAWLTKYYAAATIVPFATPMAAQDALRTGAVDALFGDDLSLIYWVAGEASRGCCKLVGGAFTDFATFSRNMSFVLAPGNDTARQVFDVALDRLQAKGVTDKLFNAYVPLNPW